MIALQRNLWSTAAFNMAAGRVLAKTAEGLRFIAKENAGGLTLQTLEMLPVRREAGEAAVVDGSLKPEPTHIKIFRRKPDEEHVRAMGEAMDWLPRQMPLR